MKKIFKFLLAVLLVTGLVAQPPARPSSYSRDRAPYTIVYGVKDFDSTAVFRDTVWAPYIVDWANIPYTTTASTDSLDSLVAVNQDSINFLSGRNTTITDSVAYLDGRAVIFTDSISWLADRAVIYEDSVAWLATREGVLTDSVSTLEATKYAMGDLIIYDEGTGWGADTIVFDYTGINLFANAVLGGGIRFNLTRRLLWLKDNVDEMWEFKVSASDLLYSGQDVRLYSNTEPLNLNGNWYVGYFSNSYATNSTSNTFPRASTFSDYEFSIGDSCLNDGGNGITFGKHAKANIVSSIATAYGRFDDTGDAQKELNIMHVATTDSTATEVLYTDDWMPQYLKYFIPDGGQYYCTVRVNGSNDGGSVYYCATRQLVIKNNGGTTSLNGTVQTVGTDITSGDVGGISLTADDTNDYLKIEVTGKPSTSMRWVVEIDALQVGFY